MKNLIIAVLITYILSNLHIWEVQSAFIPVGMFIVSVITVYGMDWFVEERRECSKK